MSVSSHLLHLPGGQKCFYRDWFLITRGYLVELDSAVLLALLEVPWDHILWSDEGSSRDS